MPITINVVDHPAKAWTKDKAADGDELLKLACPKEHARTTKLIQSSVDQTALSEAHISASKNGFVWAAYHAYSDHHHLVLRPEDVWFSILTQLNYYINANAEKLRSFFVEHEGQKQLTVQATGTLMTVDYGVLAQAMGDLISKNVKDPELGQWVTPNFSTTTDTDRTVAAVLFMGGMQKYFQYGFELTCGIPSVTLLGEVSDWEDILTRLDKLDLLGEEPTQFAEMLRPILRHMILCFQEPSSPVVADFWNTICTYHRQASGTDYLTGWITAFCFWDEEGRAKHRAPSYSLFNGVPYTSVKINAVPLGMASVPVQVNDNGTKHDTTMIAGSIGIIASHGQATSDTIQPLTGWWICENESAEIREAKAAEKKQLEEEISIMEKEIATKGQEREWYNVRYRNIYDKRERVEELEGY